MDFGVLLPEKHSDLILKPVVLLNNLNYCKQFIEVSH